MVVSPGCQEDVLLGVSTQFFGIDRQVGGGLLKFIGFRTLSHLAYTKVVTHKEFCS